MRLKLETYATKGTPIWIMVCALALLIAPSILFM